MINRPPISKALLLGGPLGLAHALREAYIARRIRRVAVCMDRERELHRMHMAQMRKELDALAQRQNSAAQRAAAHWSALL